MLNQQTIDKLHAMRMRGMAEAFVQQQEDPRAAQLCFEDRLGMLVDRQWNWRQNRVRIPVEVGHRFRCEVGHGSGVKWATDSGGKWATLAK